MKCSASKLLTPAGRSGLCHSKACARTLLQQHLGYALAVYVYVAEVPAALIYVTVNHALYFVALRSQARRLKRELLRAARMLAESNLLRALRLANHSRECESSCTSFSLDSTGGTGCSDVPRKKVTLTYFVKLMKREEPASTLDTIERRVPPNGFTYMGAHIVHDECVETTSDVTFPVPGIAAM